MSYFEVYNEKIHDLLVTREEPNQRRMPVSIYLLNENYSWMLLIWKPILCFIYILDISFVEKIIFTFFLGLNNVEEQILIYLFFLAESQGASCPWSVCCRPFCVRKKIIITSQKKKILGGQNVQQNHSFLLFLFRNVVSCYNDIKVGELTLNFPICPYNFVLGVNEKRMLFLGLAGAR